MNFDFTSPELAASSLAGVVSPFIVQYIKIKLQFQELRAFLLAVAISFGLGTAAAFITGAIDSFSGFATHLGYVLGLSTIVYNVLKASGLNNELPDVTIQS